MTGNDSKAVSRYPGATHFNEQTKALFFGRDLESADLVTKALTSRTLVLYGRSGRGKSSILEASLFPALIKHKRLPVLIRLDPGRSDFYAQVKEAVHSACEKYQVDHWDYDQNSGGLWEFLKTLSIWREEEIVQPVLAFDQFEELFTRYSLTTAEGLAAELGEAISPAIPNYIRERRETNPGAGKYASNSPPDVSYVFVIREEYLGRLNLLTRTIPSIFESRFYLSLLSKDQALDAIQQPATVKSADLKSPCFIFTEEVVELILDNGREASGGINPFNLQLICSSIENQIVDSLKPEGFEVTSEFIGGREGVARYVSNYCKNNLAQIPKSQGRGRAKSICRHQLITDDGRRIRKHEHELVKSEEDKRALDNLVKSKLVKRDRVFDDVYYELSHDILVDPIKSTRFLGLPKRVLVVTSLSIALSLVFVVVGMFSFFMYLDAKAEREKAFRLAEKNQKMYLQLVETEEEREIAASEKSLQDFSSSIKLLRTFIRLNEFRELISGIENTRLLEHEIIEQGPAAAARISDQRKSLHLIEQYAHIQLQTPDISRTVERKNPIRYMALVDDRMLALDGEGSTFLIDQSGVREESLLSERGDENLEIRASLYLETQNALLRAGDAPSFSIVQAGGELVRVDLPQSRGRVQAFDYDKESGLLAVGMTTKRFALYDYEGLLTGEAPDAVHVSRKVHAEYIAESGLVFVNLEQGLYLISAGHDARLASWSILRDADGRWDARLRSEAFHDDKTRIGSLAVNASRDTLVTGDRKGSIYIWSLDSSGEIEKLRRVSAHTGVVTALDFQHHMIGDQRFELLVSGGDETVSIWEYTSGVRLKSLIGHKSWIYAVASQGNYVVSADAGGVIHFWPVTFRNPQLYAVARKLDAVALSNNNRLLATTDSSGTMYLLRLDEDGKLLSDPPKSIDIDVGGQSRGAHRIAFSPKGDLVFLAGTNSRLTAWSIDSEGNPGTSPHFVHSQASEVHSIDIRQYSEDKYTLITANYAGEICKYEIEDLAVSHDHCTQVFEEDRRGLVATFIDEDSVIYGGGGGFVRFELGENGGIKDERKTIGVEVKWVSFDKNDNRVAVSRSDSLIQIYRIDKGAFQVETELIAHDATVWRTSFSNDGSYMLSVSYDGTLRVWSTSNWTELFRFQLPSSRIDKNPTADFDFNCYGGTCLVGVPLKDGKIVVYRIRDTVAEPV